jgi:protein TonB
MQASLPVGIDALPWPGPPLSPSPSGPAGLRAGGGLLRARTGELLPALVAVALVHAALLWWAAAALGQPREPVVMPVTLGQIVPPVPISEPQPLPMQAEPPRPRPAARPRPRPVAMPTPPAPVAPPSEFAVTALPELPPAPPAAEVQGAAPTVAAAPAAPPAPPGPEPAEPIVRPRSDAAHLSNPAPAYPAISRRLGEQGRVLLDVYILPDGSVGELRLRRSSGFARLDDAALRAVRHWRYVPARRGDEPIAYWYVQPLDFSLQ